MAWTIRLTPAADERFAALPKKHQTQIYNALVRMQADPFSGNFKRLRGKEWRGHYRRRVGRYRLIFVPDYDRQTVEIHDIVLRRESTYR